MLRNELSDLPAPMDGQAIPDDQQATWELLQQATKKVDGLRSFDRTWVEPKVEVPPSYPCDRREGIPVEVELEAGRMAAGCPGPASVGPLAEPALVDEDDGLSSAGSVFLPWASALSSSARCCPRYAPAPDRLDVARSISCDAGSSRCGRDGSGRHTPARSTRQPAPGSRDPFRNREPPDLVSEPPQSWPGPPPSAEPCDRARPSLSSLSSLRFPGQQPTD